MNPIFPKFHQNYWWRLISVNAVSPQREQHGSKFYSTVCLDHWCGIKSILFPLIYKSHFNYYKSSHRESGSYYIEMLLEGYLEWWRCLFSNNFWVWPSTCTTPINTMIKNTNKTKGINRTNDIVFPVTNISTWRRVMKS